MAVESQRIAERMRAEWDQRARENAYHYVASDCESWSEEDFDRSGRESVEDAVMEDFERVVGGRDPKSMTMLEIGCGAGRMTKPLAEVFGQVHAVDVSGEMIAKARERVAGLDNVHLHHNNGVDLSAIGDMPLDFALSYIVFQHIPDAEVIRGYIRQVGERLRPGALFKFQVQGSPEVEMLDRDTWTGVRFSALDAIRAARANDFRIEAYKGVGEHYFWLWMRKDPGRDLEPDPIESALMESENEVLNAALGRTGAAFRQYRGWSDEKLEELRRAVERMEELDRDLQALRKVSAEQADDLRGALERSQESAADLEEARAKLADLLRRTDLKAAELRSHLSGLYGSWAYRIGRRLGLAPEPIVEQDHK